MPPPTGVVRRGVDVHLVTPRTSPLGRRHRSSDNRSASARAGAWRDAAPRDTQRSTSRHVAPRDTQPSRHAVPRRRRRGAARQMSGPVRSKRFPQTSRPPPWSITSPTTGSSGRGRWRAPRNSTERAQRSLSVPAGLKEPPECADGHDESQRRNGPVPANAHTTLLPGRGGNHVASDPVARASATTPSARPPSPLGTPGALDPCATCAVPPSSSSASPRRSSPDSSSWPHWPRPPGS